MLRKPDKAAKMISYLEERLIAGVYSPGERLPSLRFLMHKFNLSYGTVQRGMGRKDRLSWIRSLL